LGGDLRVGGAEIHLQLLLVLAKHAKHAVAGPAGADGVQRAVDHMAGLTGGSAFSRVSRSRISQTKITLSAFRSAARRPCGNVKKSRPSSRC
jgi:hypothetical protein